MNEIVREAWKRHGVTPGDLFAALTPSQFVGLFGKASGSGPEVDRVEELTKHNRERGCRGLRPAIPSWL